MSRFRFLLIVVITMFSNTSFAYTYSDHDFEIDDLFYVISSENEKTVTIVDCRYAEGDLVIPKFVAFKGNTYKVTRIGGGAFALGSPSNVGYIKSVTIPNSVKSIGESAFYGISRLRSVTIPNSVTRIEDKAFYHCGLTSVDIPSSVTYVGEQAFRCALSTLTVNADTIGNKAFIECPLDSISIGDSVKVIGDYAFASCANLRSVSVGSSLEMIGKSAFDDCRKISNVHIKDIAAWCKTKLYGSWSTPALMGEHVYVNGEEVKDLVIPDGVKHISAHAFESWNCLKTVKIPNSVETIGKEAFCGCDLSSLIIGSSVISIGSGAFDTVDSVYIENLSAWCKINFSSNPLSNCNKLYVNGSEVSDLVIPDDVEFISDGAFSGCHFLSSVTIPNGVTGIGDSAFRGCEGLCSVIIPNSVTSIDEYSFYECYKLSSVTIGNAVTRIGYKAFAGSPLKNVYMLPKEAFTCNNNIFNNSVYSNAILHVPEGSEESYSNTAPWGNFFNIQSIPTGIENVKSEQPNVNSPVFYLNGIRMEKANGLPSGVYIKEGKKYFVK